MLKFSGSSCLIGGPNESGCVYAYVPNEQKETFGPPPPRRKKPRMPAHVLAESRVAGPPKKGQAKRRQQLLCGRAREASFTRLGALGETPEHSESATPYHTTRSRADRWGEWCQQTLRQACSQEYPGSARCVQSFDDSLDSASRKTYRISLRSSSLWEPRHPSLKVLQR